MSSRDERGGTGHITAGKTAGKLPPEAERALAEAAARRKTEAERHAAREVDGRGGPDPVRFGDWEVKGRAVDF